MSTRISSLSIRTTVPSTTSPCLKLLMSESCSASSSSIVVGSGPVRPRDRAGASSSSSSAAGGASMTSSSVVAAAVGSARLRRRLGLRGLGSLGRLGVPRVGDLGGFGNGLGCARRQPRAASALTAASGSASGSATASGRLRRRPRMASGGGLGGLGGGGLVGDSDRRDGLLGRRGLAGGDGLRRRRGPALQLVGQGDVVSYREFRP